MKVLFLWNGTTHYFNLITSQINKHPDIEILYVYPEKKSFEMGEGVFQTRQGANFKFVTLPEKIDEERNLLYFIGLESILKEFCPDIILLLEYHIKSFMYHENLKKIINEQKIKIILKSIPFRVKRYDELYAEIKNQLKCANVPSFQSFPFLARKILHLMRINLLYKRLFLDPKRLKKLIFHLQLQKELLNFPDAHVNYIEDAYKILGSYKVPKNKIFITYNSPDTDFYFSVKERIKKEGNFFPFNKFRIIHLSRLVKWKRVDMLLTAVYKLRIEYPQIELFILGDGPEKENLERQSQQLGITCSVKFIGGVYDAQLMGKYLMSSSIYVLAGMGGLSINDAMIFGLPVICSVCDGTEKHLVFEGYNGLYFKEGDQESLEEKIKYLFENPTLRLQMANNSVKIIKDKININTVVKGYLSAFNAVLPRSKRIKDI